MRTELERYGMKKTTAVLSAITLSLGMLLSGAPAQASTQEAYDVSAYYRADLGYKVGWKTPANKSGVTGYTVTANPGGQTCVVRSSRGTSCTFRSHVIGFTGTHDFTVTTNGRSGTLAVSAPSNAVTPASIPVSPLAIGAEVISDTQIDVAWVPSPVTGGVSLYGYTVTYWKSDLRGNPINDTRVDLTVTDTQVSLTGLDESTMYIINVASCNAYGCNSAHKWSYTPTTPITSAVTSIRLPRNIFGGTASTTCFESIYDAMNGESSTGTVCGNVVADPSTYPVVDPTATEIPQVELATKFSQRATLSLRRSYSLNTWGPIGISWFASLRADSKSVVGGFSTPVNIWSRSTSVCEVVDSKIILLSTGTCTISAQVAGNSVFRDSNVATKRFRVTR